MVKYVHGGDIYHNKINTDHSVSINPMDWPYVLTHRIESVLNDVANVYTYPDISYDRLRDTASKYTGEDKNKIVFGNGASELISGLCNLIRPKRVLLTTPCYSGYERAATAAGAEIKYAHTSGKTGYTDIDVILEVINDLGELSRRKSKDMLIIGNPSNPTGNLIPLDVYKLLVKICDDKGIILVIDECFAELAMSCDEYDKTYGSVRGKTLIRLRALTKSYRLAGLRLGYAICEDKDIAKKLYGILPEWNISTMAMKIGNLCLLHECSLPVEKRYMTASYEYIKTERGRIAQALTDMGIKVYDSSVNYMLIYSDVNLYEKLLNRGILIRDCSNITGLNKGYYRISLRDRTDNDRLIKNIREIL